MRNYANDLKKVVLAAIVLVGMLVCLVNIVGGLFYLADNSVWFFVPSVVAISLLPLVATRPRTTWSYLAVYFLTILFVASYAVDNWRWALERIQIGGFYMAPDIAACLLVGIALWVFHRKPMIRG